MKLDAYLAQHGITQQAFAETIGCQQPTVARFVMGRRIPSPELMRKITAATDGLVSPNDFFGLPQEEAA